jgi:hypothetical protein
MLLPATCSGLPLALALACLYQFRRISLIKRGDGVSARYHCQHWQWQLVFDAEPELEPR